MTSIKKNPIMKDLEIVNFIQSGKHIILKMNPLQPEVIIIEDTEIYNAQKKIFNHLWKTSLL